MFRTRDNSLSEVMGQILIVDDNKQNLKVLSRILEKEGYEITLAMNASQMFSFLDKEIPDLILLDVMMPGMDGYTACNKLKLVDDWKDIPVMFLTALTETRNILEGFKSGAVDFITKPFEVLEVLVRVETQVELKKTKEKLSEATKELKLAEAMVEEQKKLLENIDITDELTNLVNKKYIKEQIEDEIARFRRTQQIFSLAVCSVDNLESIMEIHGREACDMILKRLAAFLIDKKRKQDVIARWGEHEFMLLLPHTNIEGSCTFTERLCNEIEKSSFKFENNTLRVTTTFGVAENNIIINYEQIVGRAEEAMLNGKKAGGNIVLTDARYAFENE